MAWAIADWEKRLGRQAAEGDLEPLSWALIELGRSVNGGQYLVSVQELQYISRQIAVYFEGIDVLLTPTLAEPPAALGTFDSPPGEPLTGLFRAASYTPFTPPFNVTGQPGSRCRCTGARTGCPSGCSSSGVSATRRPCLHWPVSSSRRPRGRSAGRRSRPREDRGGQPPGHSALPE